MKEPENIDMGATQARLEDWLKSKIPNAKNLTTLWLRDQNVGGSNETHFADVTWEEGGKQKKDSLVFRLAPKRTALFLDYNLEWQYGVMKCLENSGVPVPEVRWFEKNTALLGGNFYAMSRVEGQVPPHYSGGGIFGSGLFFDAVPERRTALWWRSVEVMARLHALDWKGLGLSFLGAPGPGGNPLDREIAFWESSIDRSGLEPAPIVSKALDWIKRNKYQPQRVSLCWGDARPGNMVYRDDKVVAVLDWEMAHIGVPESDVLFFCLADEVFLEAQKVPRLEGLPGPEETVKYYEEVSGRKIENFEYHKIFQLFKMAVLTHLGARAIALAVKRGEAEMPQGLAPDFYMHSAPCRRLTQLL